MDTFKGIPSSSIGTMGLNSLILQDDISRMNDTLEQARNGCELLDDTLKVSFYQPITTKVNSL